MGFWTMTDTPDTRAVLVEQEARARMRQLLAENIKVHVNDVDFMLNGESEAVIAAMLAFANGYSKVANETRINSPEGAVREATPKNMVLVPRVMTAAMINAWSGGLTVSTDEIAGRTTFQDAWARVLAAASPSASAGREGNG